MRDLVFVGGGFRTVSFLAQRSSLWDADIEILERTSSFGVGAFGDYDCASSSVSNRFLKGIPADLLARSARPEQLVKLAGQTATPEPLSTVAQAMAAIADVMVAERRLVLSTGCHVDRVDVQDDFVRLSVRDRGETLARHVVIATGREERPAPELAGWCGKVLLSSELISLRRTREISRIVEMAASPLVITGSSHSAAAALLKLLRLRDEYARPDLEVVVVRRSGIRLHHSSLARALAARSAVHEAEVDPIADVCPETLQINRDSGLRGEGRQAFVDLMNGELANARLVVSPSLAAAKPLLDRAGLIVQALGYRGRAPRITTSGGSSRPADSDTRLISLPDATAVIGGRPQARLSVLRVEPTPVALRDHGLYGQGMYQRLAQRLAQQQLGVSR